TLTGHVTNIESITADDDYLYTTCINRETKIWDKITFEEIQSLHSGGAPIQCIAVDDKYIYLGSFRVLRIVLKENHKRYLLFKRHKNTISSIAIDDKKIYTASFDKTIKIWNKRKINLLFNNGIFRKIFYRNQFLNKLYGTKEEKTLKSNKRALSAIVTNNKYIFTGSYGNVIKIWDKKTLNVIKKINTHSGGISTLSIDNKHLYSGSLDNTIKVWKILN
ncbi:MAG: hypothetical protein U9O98_05700, partial [Asgard group archaeon]|nr:hypothetical protein [Asgard group archaeon]